MDSEIVELHKACTAGDLDLVKAIHKKSPKLAKEIVTIPNTMYYSGNALHAAVETGELKVVKYLVEEVKVDVNAKNLVGYTPLHAAAMHGFDKIIALLCANGANPNLQDVDGMAALSMAASENKIAAARELAKYGADINVINNNGNTALHASVKKKKCGAMIKFLLSCKADPSIKNNYGHTALDQARELSIAEAISALESAAASTQTPSAFSQLSDDPVQKPQVGQPEELLHIHNWKNHRNGESLNWLYERKINSENGLRTREKILDIFGPPNDEGADDEWNYAAEDDETFFTLNWNSENPDRLESWKMS